MDCVNLFPAFNKMGHEAKAVYRRGKAAINNAWRWTTANHYEHSQPSKRHTNYVRTDKTREKANSGSALSTPLFPWVDNAIHWPLKSEHNKITLENSKPTSI
jgi:hypothetical protein